MHDIAVFRVTTQYIRYNLAESLREYTFVYILNRVMHIFFGGTYASHHISVRLIHPHDSFFIIISLLFLFFAVPEFPTGESLQQQHFQSVLCRGTMFGTSFHKLSLVRVIYQVIKNSLHVHSLVRPLRTFIRMWIHTQRGAVDYHILFLHHFGRDVLI